MRVNKVLRQRCIENKLSIAKGGQCAVDMNPEPGINRRFLKAPADAGAFFTSMKLNLRVRINGSSLNLF